MDKILVTGSGGLIGSEVARMYLKRGKRVVGIDANLREVFFGPNGSVASTIIDLQKNPNYTHRYINIETAVDVVTALEDEKPDAIVHCAAQPSHDLAAKIPFMDFGTNAVGTLNMLEAAHRACPAVPFVHVSTNKVYGDQPNGLPVVEQDTRWELPTHHFYYDGIDESMSIDQCKHSLFGASKLAGDVLAQEYGRYFGMNVGVFRGGCLTGPCHAGVELHGFLSYIVKCAVTGTPYKIIGYRGKQVRDQIHSHDVATAFDAFINNPRPGEVYNLGGERRSNASVLEIVEALEARLGRKMVTSYDPMARSGDHIWYVSSMKKFRKHYPSWSPLYSLNDTLNEMIDVERSKLCTR